MNRFFSYSPDDGYDTHNTEEEARKAAMRSLDEYRDESADGWSEDVESIAWGEIRERVVITSKKTVEQYEADGDELMAERLRGEGWDYTADYGLVPVGGEK